MGKALIIKGANFSQVAVDTIDIAVGQPAISISILGQVAITSPNGEDVYYTTDGTTPTSASTKYTGAFSVQSGTTVKAVCYFGGNYSEVASQLYDGTLQAPTISITNKGVVTITATDNASIRYTTDGSDPTSSTGTVYSGAFNVENGVVVKAIAYITDGGGTTISSSVSSETAVVPEGAIFGKKFVSGATGDLTDDETRFVSPKIPITGGTSYSWVYINAVYKVDMVVEYNSLNSANEFWNTAGNTAGGSSGTGTRTITAQKDTAYVRFSGLIGAAQAGMKITSGDNTLWEYDGSTE